MNLFPGIFLTRFTKIISRGKRAQGVAIQRSTGKPKMIDPARLDCDTKEKSRRSFDCVWRKERAKLRSG
jgi:hypothetical protein